MIPLSETTKWRFREVKLLVQGHTASQGWSWYPILEVWVTNPGSRLPLRSEAAPSEKQEGRLIYC